MAFVKIPEELLSAELSAAQFRVLAHLIHNSFDDGYSYLGYDKLAKLCFTNKSAMIKLINSLVELGFIEKTKRGAFNRSNALRLTLSSGYNRLQVQSGDSSADDPKGCLNDTLKGCLNDTLKGCLNDTEGCLNDTEGCLNDTPHKDIRFKYQDLNTKNSARARKGCLNDTPREAAGSGQIAPTDGAAGRSMPEPDLSGGNQQKKVPDENQLDICDSEIVSAIMPVINGFTHMFELFRVGGQYGLRPMANIDAFRAKGEELREAVQAAAASRGRVLTYLPKCDRFKNEIIINFYNYSKGAA